MIFFILDLDVWHSILKNVDKFELAATVAELVKDLSKTKSQFFVLFFFLLPWAGGGNGDGSVI